MSDIIEYKGIVKFFDSVKRFGFITTKGLEEKEIFVHGTRLKEAIEQDDNVVFNVVQGKQGLNAVNVRKQ